MAHILFREAFNPIHIQDKKQIVYEIEMSISQPIIVGFEKLKRQNFHESVHFNVEFFTPSPPIVRFAHFHLMSTFLAGP